MPLDAEFRNHLHDLMVETSGKLRDEINKHERQLLWEARQTHNAAALPNAYSKAKIYAFRTRVEATIARYLDALETCDIEVDSSVEQEMLQIIRQLTSAAQPLQLPPALNVPNVSAVQRAHTMELARVGNHLYLEAANRLREAKIKARRTSKDSRTSITMSRTESSTIASVPKTLAELKGLPRNVQATFLLGRLTKLYSQTQGAGGLHKGNLLLPDDSYALAAGFPSGENTAVRQHLLGVPWTLLANEGFLVDLSGNGFFSVTEEGLAATRNATDLKTLPAASGIVNSPAANDAVPTVFISYSWDAPEHKEWVLRLALRTNHRRGPERGSTIFPEEYYPPSSE